MSLKYFDFLQRSRKCTMLPLPPSTHILPFLILLFQLGFYFLHLLVAQLTQVLNILCGDIAHGLAPVTKTPTITKGLVAGPEGSHEDWASI